MLLIPLTILFVYGGYVVALEPAEPVAPAESVDNEAQIEGFVDIHMAVNPAIMSPGEEMVLELTATNRGTIDAPIAIDSIIPSNVTFEIAQLQSSTTFNLQANSFAWQPVIPAGETRTFTLPLRAGVADMTQPLQEIVATYRYGQIVETLSAEIWIGILPTAKILVVDEVSVGQPLKLRADISGPGPFSQAWDLGDGRSFSAADPAINYATAGDYTIELTVNNPLGKTTVEKTITVKPDPIALFSLDDPTPMVGQQVTFLNQSGGAGDMDYYWEFGDGQSALVRQPQHQFDEAGTYNIKLVVENEYGRSETELPLTVGSAPSVDMNLSEQAATGEPFNGFAFSDDETATFLWQMGDGSEVEGSQLSYIYKRPGDYIVTVTASNDFGTTRTTQQVIVEKGVLRFFIPVISKGIGAPLLAAPAQQIGTTQDTTPVVGAGGIVLATDSSGQPAFFSTFVPIDLSADSVPFDSTQEQRLLWYINKARLSVGLNPYEYNESLSQAAQRHTNDMAFNAFWGHDGSDGSRPAERQEAAGYAGGYGGEATAWGFEYPSGAVGFWLDSPTHRPLILNPNADQVGIAFTYNEDSGSIYYWTAEFGRADGTYAYPFFPTEATPTPAVPPAAAATQPPLITPTPTQEIVIAPTTTPEIVVSAEPTATPQPTATPPPTATSQPTRVIIEATEEPTATPTEEPPTATPTDEPTATPTATNEPTATPQPTPTELPTTDPTPTEAIIIATSTPPVEPTPTPEPEASSNSGEAAPIVIVATSTPSATATPDGDSAGNGRTDSTAAQTAAQQFLQAIIRDPEGYAALPFATYAMQNELLNEGVQAVLSIDASLESFVLANVFVEDTSGVVSAELIDSNGTSYRRNLHLAFVENQWRVDSVSSQ